LLPQTSVVRTDGNLVAEAEFMARVVDR